MGKTGVNDSEGMDISLIFENRDAWICLLLYCFEDI